MKENLTHKYWNKEADTFNMYYEKKRTVFGFFVKKFLNERLKIVKSFLDVEKAHNAIDIGCGSGYYLEMLYKMGMNVTGVDSSQKMLALSEKRLEKITHTISTEERRRKPYYTLIQSDARNIKIESNSYDIALAIGILDYLKDIESVLSEINRVLKTGGRLIVTIPKVPSFFLFLRTPLGNRLRYSLFKLPPIITALNKKKAIELVNKAGFKIIDTKSIQTTMWVLSCIKR